MFDITLRPLKDRCFNPLSAAVPQFITPLQLTAAAFVSGVGSCAAASNGSTRWAVVLWILNRVFDCLDGAVARHRRKSSDLGGFLDLLSDFVIYSSIPICCAMGLPLSVDVAAMQRRWLAVAIVESTFHVNNFVLFYIAAVAEKRKALDAKTQSKDKRAVVKELTSLTMKPALVEGAESGLLFTIMLAVPSLTAVLCCVLAVGVIAGTAQRVLWLAATLKTDEHSVA